MNKNDSEKELVTILDGKTRNLVIRYQTKTFDRNLINGIKG